MQFRREQNTASMRSMTFLQVDRCSNEPFSTYCVYCVFYQLILRILRILQIVILEYCVYCVFYKLTSANIAYIAYIALRILRNTALRCVAYFTTSQLILIRSLVFHYASCRLHVFTSSFYWFIGLPAFSVIGSMGPLQLSHHVSYFS